MLGICSMIGADELAMVIHGALERAGADDAFPFEPGAAAELARTVDALKAAARPPRRGAGARGPTASTSAVVNLVVEQIRALTGPVEHVGRA